MEMHYTDTMCLIKWRKHFLLNFHVFALKENFITIAFYRWHQWHLLRKQIRYLREIRLRPAFLDELSEN